MLTLSLSGLRRDPHSALLDTGRLTRSVAGGRCFLLADLLLLVRRTIDFAAQSNLAFLGMWITSNGVYQAELLPFDADAGSTSNMVSSQRQAWRKPGRHPSESLQKYLKSFAMEQKWGMVVIGGIQENMRWHQQDPNHTSRRKESAARLYSDCWEV